MVIPLMVGTCSCGVKTPEVKFHDDACVYRRVADISVSIEARAREFLAAARKEGHDAAFEIPEGR